MVSTKEMLHLQMTVSIDEKEPRRLKINCVMDFKNVKTLQGLDPALFEGYLS